MKEPILNNINLHKMDINYIWHPCTQMKDHEILPLIPIKYAKGVYLYDFDGNKYIDAISSWWVNLFGHCNEYINDKIKNQLEKLEHVILAGFTHEPAIKLAKKLVTISPTPLKKVFFADNGSSAIEIALKMSYHYFKNKGKEKEYFLSLTNSYHGETLGALSVGDVKLYKDIYKPLLIKNIQTPVPKDKSIEAAKEALLVLEKILQKDATKISAFIVEPLIQGAGNMHMYHPYYLKKAKELCQEYDILFIADEIMTGFGRSGTMFACEQAQISPDIMCLSKGLSGGYLPLSVVLTTNKIYQAFYCDYNEGKSFLHSHSFTGNPLACSAALASLELFEKENILEKNKKTAAYIAKKLELLKNNPNVTNIRQTGMIAAFDIKNYDPIKRTNLTIYTYALNHGVLLRPLAQTIYIMPPYIIKEEEIDTIFEVIQGALNLI